MASRITSMEAMNHYYSTLTLPEREELLQCLLIASTRGGAAMMCVLEEVMLVTDARALIDDLPVRSGEGDQHTT